MVIIAVVIFFGVILGILIVEYGQKRSFSSWLVEKMFAYRKYKLSKKVDNYKGVETQRNRNIPYHLDNPEEIVGFSTQEYDVNGMQVFIINDQKQVISLLFIIFMAVSIYDDPKNFILRRLSILYS